MQFQRFFGRDLEVFDCGPKCLKSVWVSPECDSSKNTVRTEEAVSIINDATKKAIFLISLIILFMHMSFWLNLLKLSKSRIEATTNLEKFIKLLKSSNVQKPIKSKKSTSHLLTQNKNVESPFKIEYYEFTNESFSVIQ